MAKDLAYYQTLPYERECSMRMEGNERYYIVRLKDIPAVAGDGATLEEASEDLRAAFDEFVVAWIAADKPIPLPARGFTVPADRGRIPLREWETALGGVADAGGRRSSESCDVSAVYGKEVLVEESKAAPRLEVKAVVPA
jgi:predicted RNase H-like HicB family nuclease